MSQLSDSAVNIKLKLSGLWPSTMFCYIYSDYFELYTPGKLEGMIAGDLRPALPLRAAAHPASRQSLRLCCTYPMRLWR